MRTDTNSAYRQAIDKQIYELGVSGLLHDIGKTKVPASILNKPARLTDEEFAVMKQQSGCYK